MRKLQVLFVLTVITSLFLVSASNAAPKQFTIGLPAVAGAPAMTYDGATGNLSMAADPGITTWELKSTGGKFNCENINPESLDPFFGTCSADKVFTTWPSGSNALDFGNIYPTGQSGQSVVDDTIIDGSLVGGGALDRDDAAAPYLVPEPTSLSLFGLGLLGLLGLRRNRK